MTVLDMSLSAAILILAIVIIRALALHRLPKKTFLVLWGVALCRLLIPLSIPSRFSVYTLANILKSNTSTIVNTPDIVTAVPNITTAAGVTNSVPLTDMAMAAATMSPITAVWMIGLLACALFFLVTHLRCRKIYKTALPVGHEFVKQWLSEHPTRRRVQIRQSDKIAATLTYGVFRPVILLPKTTDWTDETRLRYILTHEFTHIRRFDTLTKLALAAAVCVHWLNPLVWVMYILANRDIELSCDETVIRTFGETIKSAYALTLIGLEEKKSRLAPLVNNFSKNAIEERIVSIMKMKRITVLGTVLATIVVAAMTTAFATTAAGTREPPVTEDSLASDFSAMAETAPSPEANYTLIPAYRFLYEEDLTGTDKPSYWNAVSYIYGNHYIAAGVGDFIPAGVYVSDDGKSCYVIDKKSDGTSTKTVYSITGSDYEDYEVVSVETLPAATAGVAPTSSLKDDSTENDILTENDELRALLQNSQSEQQTNTASPKPSPANEDTSIQKPSPASGDNGGETDNNSSYVYPVNKNGETYGSSAYGHPDLVAALGTEGQSGYIREEEIPGANVSTPEEAAKYMEWRKTQPSRIMIPLYDQEGNVIGEFGISNSPSVDYDSLEEAREAVANGN